MTWPISLDPEIEKHLRRLLKHEIENWFQRQVREGNLDLEAISRLEASALVDNLIAVAIQVLSPTFLH